MSTPPKIYDDADVRGYYHELAAAIRRYNAAKPGQRHTAAVEVERCLRIETAVRADEATAGEESAPGG